jgi:hypothetical protein
MPAVPTLTVDTQELIDDPALFGLGAKARVDHFLSTLPNGSPIREKVVGFVDREWEEMVDIHTHDPLPWCSPTQTDIRLKTSGHSIENYGFSVDFVEKYLRHFGKSVATEEVVNAVRLAVPESLRAGAAFSEVARRRQLISRCTDILDLSDVSWSNGRLIISSAVDQKLVNRGALNAVGFISDFNQRYTDRWSTAPFSTEADLHAHGHIGEMVLWMAVAKIVVNSGFSEAVAQELATGRRDERRRVWHVWLASRPLHELSPLDHALA